VGSFTAAMPSPDFADNFFESTQDNVDKVLDGKIPTSTYISGAEITIEGTVNAVGDVSLLGHSIHVDGDILSGAEYEWSASDFSDVVNLTGLEPGGEIEVEGGTIHIVSNGDARITGTLLTGGGAPIEIEAPEIAVTDGAALNAGTAGNITLTADK